MKRIFSLAIALIATIGIANAQDEAVQYDMYVTTQAGDVITYKTEKVESVTFGVRPDPNEGWTSLGYCHYGEDIIGSLFNLSDDPTYFVCDYYVEVQEKDDQPGLYRLVDPYAPEIYPFASWTEYDTSEEDHWYIEINACDPEGVYVEEQYLGIIFYGPDGYSYGGVYCISEAAYWMARGYTLEQEKGWGETGSLVDGVITFPYQMFIAMLPTSYPSWYFAVNEHNGIYVDLNDKSDTPGEKNIKARAKEIPSENNIEISANVSEKTRK